jgi:hypothetical protein
LPHGKSEERPGAGSRRASEVRGAERVAHQIARQILPFLPFLARSANLLFFRVTSQCPRTNTCLLPLGYFSRISEVKGGEIAASIAGCQKENVGG